jgi:small subunit ribosomal protein S3
MGQKVNPHGLRVGIIKNWSSVWYSEKDVAKYILEDNKIRKIVKKKLYSSGISHIDIHRTSEKARIIIYTAKPGMVIGRNGQAIAELTEELQKFTDHKVSVAIEEIKRPETNAQLAAEDVAKQLENRVAFRRATRQVITRAMKAGVKGIKVSVSGRLAGADMARTEHYHEGTIPLQTLRADIDYGFAEANTTYGKIGVKVWMYKGEVLPGKNKKGEMKNVNAKKK